MGWVASKEIFTAAVLTETVELDPQTIARCGYAELTIDLTGFSGTLDIQGKGGLDSESYANIEYALVAATPTLAVAQITDTTATAVRKYLIPNPRRVMQIVMTRSAGSITAFVDYYAGPAVLI